MRLSAAFVLAVTLALPAAARPSDTAPAQSQSRVEIFNFGQVSDAYYRGGELKPRDASYLSSRGVRTVVDLRSDKDFKPSEAQLVSSVGMKYIRIPMTTRTAPTPEQVATFLSIVSNPDNQPVYVHCVEGRHRTGVMTAVYRMTLDGWTPDRAFDEMKDYKFGMDFLHPEFKKFVYSYRPLPQPAADETPRVSDDAVRAVRATD